jgi:hypothetical protein
LLVVYLPHNRRQFGAHDAHVFGSVNTQDDSVSTNAIYDDRNVVAHDNPLANSSRKYQHNLFPP